MKKYVLTFALACLSFNIQATNLINHEQVIDQQSCFTSIFADYKSWRNAMKKKYKRKIKSNVNRKKALARFDRLYTEEQFDLYKSNLSCTRIKYRVDGNTVKGYVIQPKQSESKLPVLIYNRGGNGNFGGVVFGSMMHNLFPIANEGFVIVGSQYRETFIKSTLLRDEFGGQDVKDVTALIDIIPSIEGADAQRIGMYGASRGGMQTHLALKQTNKIKAIATISGVTDLLKELEFRPVMEKVYRKRIPDYQGNKVDELKKRSVIHWVEELSPTIPILLLHGDNDKRVSVNNSIEFAKALSTHNIPHKLVVYPNDNHGLMQNKKQANQELVTWFKKYL